jgi:hypothetical protein
MIKKMAYAKARQASGAEIGAGPKLAECSCKCLCVCGQEERSTNTSSRQSNTSAASQG